MAFEPNLLKTSAETNEDPGIRVMVVDDSAVIRGLISRMIRETPGMDVVASAGNGSRAIAELERADIDVIVLDIEMPIMDGLTALPQLLKIDKDVKIIMASTLTGPNADASLRALALGAADYLSKPTSSRDVSGVGGSDTFRRDLIAKIQGLGEVARKAPNRRHLGTSGAPRPVPQSIRQPVPKVTLRPRKTWNRRPGIIAVGSSTGGPQALMSFFSAIPSTIGIPIIVTQHMPPKFTTTLAAHISRKCDFPCVEGEDDMPVTAGRIILAPGDYHMTVTGSPAAPKIKLNQEPPENFCRPAVDPMLRSLVPIYGDRVLSVILTGMGHDGRKGSDQIVAAGGEVFAQDEESSVVWGMPGAVATAGLCSAVLPLAELPKRINEIVSKAMP